MEGFTSLSLVLYRQELLKYTRKLSNRYQNVHLLTSKVAEKMYEYDNV